MHGLLRLIVAQVRVHRRWILVAQFVERVLEDFTRLRWIVVGVFYGRVDQLFVIVAIFVISVVVVHALLRRSQATFVDRVDERMAAHFIEREVTQWLTSCKSEKIWILVCAEREVGYEPRM